MVAAVISGRPNSDGFAKYARQFKDSKYIKGIRQVLHGSETPAGYSLEKPFVAGIRLLEPGTLDSATRLQSTGEDVVLGYETSYATGFQLPFPFRPMAGEGSFGHYGMGGSVAFANRRLDFSFAYVMNQMQSSGGVDPRPAALVEALVESLG